MIILFKGTERKQIKLNDDFDENQFGDKFIREAKITREQEIKLNMIETELEKLKSIKNQSDISSDQFSENGSNNVYFIKNTLDYILILIKYLKKILRDQIQQ